jgi:hypothetical protein
MTHSVRSFCDLLLLNGPEGTHTQTGSGPAQNWDFSHIHRAGKGWRHPYCKDRRTGQRRGWIARVQGFVVFVPGANVGDEAKVRINEVRPRFATAEVVREQAPFT